MKFTPESALAVIESVTKAPPGYRRGHARGLVLRGRFTASPAASQFTFAEHFQGESIPCLVRFSNASGHPCAPDMQSATAGRVLGMALRFDLPSGAHATWAGINLRAFPARTPEEFIALTQAQAPGKKGKPNFLKLVWHVLSHLHILAGVKAAKGLKPSRSFAAETYHGLHTYFFVSAGGERKPFRYRWVPKGKAFASEGSTLNADEASHQKPLYLLDEVRRRILQSPLEFELIAQWPEAEDDLNAANQPWPDTRLTLKLGELRIEAVHEDQKAVEGVVFDPTGVVPGLELSDDPILRFRAQIYGLSYERRMHETRTEPAPSDMGQ
jgi:catalase